MTEGEVVLITGGSSGIGAATAKLLAKQGAKVVINYRENEDDAKNLVQEIIREGCSSGLLMMIKADVSSEVEVRNMIDKAIKKFGRIDALVNNASPKTSPLSFQEAEWQDFQKFLDVVVKGAYNLAKFAVPVMKERKKGNIVSVLTSYTIGMPPAKLAPYITAKYALEGLSKSLAAELGAYGIRVNMVSPSMMKTNFTKHLPEKMFEIAAMQSPLKRLTTPEDVAQVILFLISDQSRNITGVNIPISGGLATF